MTDLAAEKVAIAWREYLRKRNALSRTLSYDKWVERDTEFFAEYQAEEARIYRAAKKVTGQSPAKETASPARAPRREHHE